MLYEKVLLDIEVQRDFFAPTGACYVPAAAEAARNVRRLFAWARRDHIPVISTMLRVMPPHHGPLAPAPHCLENTPGERRLPGTLTRHYVDLGMRGSTDMPTDIFEQVQQVVFEKRHTDIFLHSRAERLITELEARTIIVCGAGSAHGVVEAVVGLRHRGFRIVLAADAILDLGDPLAEMAWLRMLAKGAVPRSTEEIVAPAAAHARHLRQAQPAVARPFLPARAKAMTG